MAQDNLLRLPTGQLRVSRIVYFTDLIHSDSREFPVGVVAEVNLPLLRGLGTALRPDFPESELAMMGPTAREILTNPMGGLWPNMKEAFSAAGPGATLARLMERYSSSISILAPCTLDVPRQWLIKRDMKELTEIVRERLKVTVTDEYFKYLFPPREDGVTDPAIEEDMEEAKAA
jgi:hypothetical protein